ncbi:MAG TPA: hypothetical protein PKG63_02440 [Bacteroidales bacterium]|jgi:hypothetical protein|nr:hypothetical protein [Bacteroidales bacterium]HNV95307.1 hypothetical protein [Bacteroidales bacterium]
MITFLTLLTISILNVQLSFEQMLGKSKKEIQTIMNSSSEFNINNFGVSTNDNTLRYYNAKKDVTLIFYFNKSQNCMHIKWIEDIDAAEKKVQELNQKYKKSGKNWTTNTNNKNVIIELDKEEYNYSLNYHY